MAKSTTQSPPATPMATPPASSASISQQNETAIAVFLSDLREEILHVQKRRADGRIFVEMPVSNGTVVNWTVGNKRVGGIGR